VIPRIALVHGIDRDLHDWDAVLPGLADLGETRPVDSRVALTAGRVS
jgi:hypothetical protein